MSGELDTQEIEFLTRINSGNWTLKDGVVTSPKVKALISRGYCKTFPEKIGPLAQPTGEIAISITEAGRIILQGLK